MNEAARVAFRLPEGERKVLGRVLKADLLLLSSLEAEIVVAEEALAELLPQTPAEILTMLPGVAVVRASNYGVGIGDPHRFPYASAAYRAAGLVPTMFESAGRRRGGQHISREGSVDLRRAIIEMAGGCPSMTPTSPTEASAKVA